MVERPPRVREEVSFPTAASLCTAPPVVIPLHVLPSGLYVPPSHGAQTKLSPLPLTAWPGVQMHVELPGPLVLPSGHGVHSVAPGLSLKVSASHSAKQYAQPRRERHA